MKKNKIVIYVVAMCVWAYLQIQGSWGNDLLHAYDGVVFNSTIAYYVKCFFLFACYSLYTYNEFETHMNQYGIILVTREASRDKLLLHLAQRLLKFILQIEVLRVVCYGLMLLLMKQSITVSSPIDFVRSIFLNILVCFLILFIQMIVEIWYSGNIAVVISLTSFLIGLGISDIIERSEVIPSTVNLLFVQNLTMRIRVESMVENDGIMIAVIIGLLMGIVGMYFITQLCFRKKDIL